MKRALIGVVALSMFAGFYSPLRAADAQQPKVELNADNVSGRPLEDLTKQAIVRDYAKAWKTLATAMDQNRADLIDADFVGIAQEKLAAGVEQQAKAGLHTRYVDRGHKVDVLFYSPEGLSVELRDTASLERQVLDGDKVLFTEAVTAHYVSLMSPTEVRWKVRLLQEIPNQ